MKKFLIAVLVIMISVGVLVVVIKLTGTGSSVSDMFVSVEVNGVSVNGHGSNFKITSTPSVVQLKSLLNQGYELSIIPKEGVDFSFIVNGYVYSFSSLENCISGFDIVLENDYFTISALSLDDVLSKLFIGDSIIISYIPEEIPSGDLFTLIVNSGSKKTLIDFTVVIDMVRSIHFEVIRYVF